MNISVSNYICTEEAVYFFQDYFLFIVNSVPRPE